MENCTFFNRIRNSKFVRFFSAFLVINILAEIISPTAAYALTSGPSSPEFSSFEPVATTDMVNDFTGDFTYNIPVLNVPGPDGGGYSMSLAYHSGATSEEEASWVGFGWTLNPGSINRGKKGFPDEFNGEEIKTYHKQKPSWNQGAKFDLNLEYNSQDDNGDKNKKSDSKADSKFSVKFPQFSKPDGNSSGGSSDGDSDPGVSFSVSLSHSIRFNNYSGFSIANSFGVGAMGAANLSMNRSGGQNTFGFSVNPMAIMSKLSKSKKANIKKFAEKVNGTKLVKTIKKINELHTRNVSDKNMANNMRNGLRIPTSYSLKVNNAPALSYSVGKTAGAIWKFSASVQLNPNIPVGIQVGMAGDLGIQAHEGVETKHVYGYYYSSQSDTDPNNSTYDYQIEKETTFNKHDKNLGIPFNNADQFSVIGNNAMGGFKLYHDQIGTFYPEHSESFTKIRQLGVELGIGATLQIGFDIGVGKQKTEVTGKWKNEEGASVFDTSKQPKLRFMGDKGGEIQYDPANKGYGTNIYASIDKTTKKLQNSGLQFVQKTTNNGTSSNIEYTQHSSTTNPYIDSLKITNKDGGISNYGLPVLTKNETELSIGLNQNQDGTYLAYQDLFIDDPMKNHSAVGQKVDAEYPNSYLLTSNTTFNYIDVSNNGPTDDDFGGWTKFDYKKAYGDGTPNGWYRYRSPYNGLNYNSGRMLDPNDQTGSMSSGDKEVYYLKCIETKSHIAFFVTNKTSIADFSGQRYAFLVNPSNSLNPQLISGSGVSRKDGLDAAGISAGMDNAAFSQTAQGSHELEKLERIVLFAKSDLSKPLTTTFFEYDYSLCPGIPNSLNTYMNVPLKEKGKLTLKRVWTESGGVNNSKISPYQFHYEYFNNYPNIVKSKYSWANNLYTASIYPTNDPKQNPMYKPEQLDPWGFYQTDGANRFSKMQHWVYQREQNASDFDPAAWQLKRIQLPSGGEIHIHYEQKDYTKVQNETPMAMVSLKNSSSTENKYKSDESVYVINTDDIGVPPSALSSYTYTLKNHFISQKNKLYFKVLYTYTGDDAPTINSGSKRYEYVTGYVAVNDITTSGSDILLHLGEKGKNENGKKDYTLPRYVCYQELMNTGGENLGLNAKSYVSDDYTDAVYDGDNPLDEDDFKVSARQHVLSNTLDMFTDWLAGNVKNKKRDDACKYLNEELSYFKLPVFNAKKGGGVRVKRIITYDPGINGENGGDAMVYGSEYNYVNEDGSSSGVAVNEPAESREENALVGYMERKKQKWIDKITNGRDTKQFEGPVGESVLPAASVGHSRIVISNIHSGKTTTGYVVNKYYTAKDFPFDADFSTIDKEHGTYRKFNLSLPLGLFNLDIHKAWVSQGYLFKLNDMHGKLASKATYSGKYEPLLFNESTFTSKTINNYSAPYDAVPTLVYDGNNFVKANLNPGTEEDVTMFSSNVTETGNDFSVEVDLNVSYYPLSLSVGFGISYSLSKQQLCQHVTSKVINYTSHLLSTTNITDGVTQTTENIAFDKYTGDPVLTRTFDGYTAPSEKINTEIDGVDKHSGYYYSLNIPASWMYSKMGPKLNSTSDNFNQLTTNVGNVVTYGSNELYENLFCPTCTTTANNSWSPVSVPLTKVISASATTYTNNWFNSPGVLSDYAIPSQYLSTVTTKLNGFYYPLKTYAYRDEVKNANQSTVRLYNGGVISANFKFFDWNPNSTNPSEWYSDATITRYSPYGYPVEEEDVLGIKSSAKFGYNNTLPVSVVKNASYNECAFVDFEYSQGFSPNYVTNTFAHSGARSYDWSNDPQVVLFHNYPLSSDIISKKGLGIKLWLRSSLNDVSSNPNYKLKNPNPLLKALIGNQQFSFKQVAQTGEWSLFIADIKNFNGIGQGLYDIKLLYNNTPNEKVLIDDIRIQPLDASMNCSVYYADNKLAAQFDDQHFGVFYEYNHKGQLTRKSIETERGKKTLQEQQYNTPEVIRN